MYALSRRSPNEKLVKRSLKARLKVLLKVLIRLLKARLKVLLRVLKRLLKGRLKVLLKVLVRLSCPPLILEISSSRIQI